MAQTTYQIAQLVTSQDPNTAAEACQVLSSAILNAIAYGLSLERVILDGSGRLRFTLNNPFPPDEVASFAGAFVEV